LNRDSLPDPEATEGVDDSTLLMLDYYQRPLALLSLQYLESNSKSKFPHSIRSRFWQFVEPRDYDYWEGRGLIEAYLNSVENELKTIIGNCSICYWLHIYRRIYPGSIGTDNTPQTIGLTRAVFEAAIQKYAKTESCSRIGLSDEVDIQEVFNGLLMAPDLAPEREYLQKTPSQLVLTHFSAKELKELYDTEKLAYEIWRSGATLRSIAKGSPFFVEESDTRFGDDRPDDLDQLLKIYDSRIKPFTATAIGAQFNGHNSKNLQEGHIFLPVYNLTGITTDTLRDFFLHFKIDLKKSLRPNFVWVPFNLRAFRDIHLPLADAFQQKYGVELDAVLAVVSCLNAMVVYLWLGDSPEHMIRHWQRAYDAPSHRQNIVDTIIRFRSAGCRILGISEDQITKEKIESAIDFWKLPDSREKDIDLVYSGPHYMFLPFEDYLFVDYAWILRRLYDLFHGISIPDQNFKGLALEAAMQPTKSILPSGPCKSMVGEERQVDYACEVNGCLIIAECKAVSRSIGFDRGDPKAIQYRTERVVNKSLAEADEKADWLAKNPKGSNYDITGYQKILPVGISPFVEFIPSLETKYWINNDLPRVLTPDEFFKLIANPESIQSASNCINLKQ